MKAKTVTNLDAYKAHHTMHLIEEKAHLTYVMNSWILVVQRQARRNIHAQCKAIIEGNEHNAER